MLATKFHPDNALYPLYVQPKLNGIRAICDRAKRTFQTRNGEFWFDEMTAHIFRHLDALDLPVDINTKLDGEFYVHGWPLQRIAAAITVVRQVPIDDTLSVQYWIYDTITIKPFVQRIKNLVQETQLVRVVPTTEIRRKHDLDAIHSQHIADGFEGTMVRHGSAPYREGLTNALQKLKKKHEYEVQVVGCIEGEGKFINALGAFVVEDPVRGVQFKVGSGYFTKKLRKQYWLKRPIGKWITIASEAGLSANGIPLQAQFIAMRDYE